MAVGDILEVKFYCSQDIQLGINVRHYRIASVVGVERTRAQIASHLSGLFQSDYKGIMSTSARFEGVGVRKIRPLPISIEELYGLDAGTGNRTGDPLPLQTAGLITLRTATAGRKGRGRVYLPFPAEIDNTSTANPLAGYITALGVMADRWVGDTVLTAGLDVTTLTSVVYNRATGLGTNITGRRVSSFWATQRRRGDLSAANVPFPV